MLTNALDYWPLLLTGCAAIAAFVVFGKNLAELILKWREVFSHFSKKHRNPATRSRDAIENHTSTANIRYNDAIINSNKESVLRSERFQARAESENNGHLLKYRISDGGVDLSYLSVLDMWEDDSPFVDFYISIFKKCGFDSYVWETPPISTGTVGRTFEFVLHDSPRSSQIPDHTTYASYFDTASARNGIVTFYNLGRDALLVVPSPYREDADYSGLAEFFREAPLEQQRALWRELAHQVKSGLSDQPTWISVAGGGIAWLHIRIDSVPKYYRYPAYISQDQ